ncbi:hypothetical protein FRZ44_39220 [Hypericibacter terrae]|uniref:Uncharacterized protein n=1 Tax=Hypericibacter terrae TaxID=2602015 RepID=A0A5J6MPP0_9PROT|nr:hypothetical protein [Hypericibacter terrae]QEX18615.1 hypothetical protein FRZ44_39220 [Hypericibacter terrae]
MKERTAKDIMSPSHRITFDEAVQIWLHLWNGARKHRLASYYDVNVWRIYDVISGKLHPGSESAATKIRKNVA